MKNKKKICFITGGRADYDLLYPLIQKVNKSKELELQLIVTGMHLSKEFGNTQKRILNDGFIISKKIKTINSKDTELGIVKSFSLGTQNIGKTLAKIKPDLVVVLGDRSEIYAGTCAAFFLNIPIAHIHGGEVTSGSMDDIMRHAITKHSHLHFVSTKEYKKRVIQLGEKPNSVFNVGSLGVENIKNLKLMSKYEVEQDLKISLGVTNFLITYHPVTLERDKTIKEFKNLLQALNEFSQITLIFTKSNSDLFGRKINQIIDLYVKQRKNAYSFMSLGKKRYLSLMSHVDGLLGNSSSAIIESPSFKIGSINIGNRQKGRIIPDNIINSRSDAKSIKSSIKLILSEKFKKKLKMIKNPYDKKNVSKNIYEIIKKNLSNKIINKEFHDID